MCPLMTNYRTINHHVISTKCKCNQDLLLKFIILNEKPMGKDTLFSPLVSTQVDKRGYTVDNWTG